MKDNEYKTITSNQMVLFFAIIFSTIFNLFILFIIYISINGLKDRTNIIYRAGINNERALIHIKAILTDKDQ